MVFEWRRRTLWLRFVSYLQAHSFADWEEETCSLTAPSVCLFATILFLQIAAKVLLYDTCFGDFIPDTLGMYAIWRVADENSCPCWSAASEMKCLSLNVASCVDGR